MDYVKTYESTGGPVTDRIKELTQNSKSQVLDSFVQLLLDTIQIPHSLTENSSFEAGGLNATFWGKWIPKNGTIERTETLAYSGSASLLVGNMERGGPTQTFDVQPGLTAVQVQYYTPPGTEAGSVKMVLKPKNEQSKNLLSFSSVGKELSETAGRWNSLNLLIEIPETVNGEKVTKSQVVVTIDGAQDTQVYLDDFVV